MKYRLVLLPILTATFPAKVTRELSLGRPKKRLLIGFALNLDSSLKIPEAQSLLS